MASSLRIRFSDFSRDSSQLVYRDLQHGYDFVGIRLSVPNSTKDMEVLDMGTMWTCISFPGDPPANTSHQIQTKTCAWFFNKFAFLALLVVVVVWIVICNTEEIHGCIDARRGFL